MRLLIVDDEANTVSYLRKGLTESGFVVDTAVTGQEGLFLATSRPYDLIVLDVMLPGHDGWSILQELRSAGKQTPVLFLTARGSVQDRVRGFELGADDYLIKPFAFSELLGRVKSILRRAPGRQPDILRVSDLELDLLRRKATRSNKPLDLTPKEFLLLTFLARHTGEVLTRTLISEQVWDMNFESDTNVIDVAILRLRRKVDDPFPNKLIHAERGVGYVFEERKSS